MVEGAVVLEAILSCRKGERKWWLGAGGAEEREALILFGPLQLRGAQLDTEERGSQLPFHLPPPLALLHPA